MSPIIHFSYWASHPANKHWLTKVFEGFTTPSIHSHSQQFLIFFHRQRTPTHACKWTAHTGNPSFQFTVHWGTSSCFSCHKIDKHIYSWFLGRERQTVNTAWQDRHVFLSGRILHAFVKLCNVYCGSVCEQWKTLSPFIKYVQEAFWVLWAPVGPPTVTFYINKSCRISFRVTKKYTVISSG